MDDLKKLFLFLAVAALFTSGIAAGVPVFADGDDDKDDKKKKKNKVLTGEGPPRDKLGKKGDGYIDNASENCDYYIKTAKKTWTLSETLCEDPGTGGDLEARVSTLEQFVQDVMNGIANLVSWNSLKDVPADIADGDDVDDADNDPTNEIETWSTLTGIPADFADEVDDVDDADADSTNELQDWSTLPGIPADIADGDDDTQYSGVDFATSNQGCAVGFVVTGIDVNGAVTCAVDQTGSGSGGIISNVQSFSNMGSGGAQSTGPIPGLIQTFTVDSDATIFVTTFAHYKHTDDSFNNAVMDIVLDGNIMSRSLVNAPSTDRNFFSNSWTGIVSPGTHTVSIDAAFLDTTGEQICDAGSPYCRMNILIFEE